MRLFVLRVAVLSVVCRQVVVGMVARISVVVAWWWAFRRSRALRRWSGPHRCGDRLYRVARIERQYVARDDGRYERRRGAPFGSDQQDRPSSGW